MPNQIKNKEDKKAQAEFLEDYRRTTLEHSNAIIKYFVEHPMKKGQIIDVLTTINNHVNNLDLQIDSDVLFNVKKNV